MADHPRTAPPLDALAMALRARRPPPGLVRHTARGGRYTATGYQARRAARGLVRSMSRSGRCLDNAMAERSFATRKSELTATQRRPTRAAARTAIFAWSAVCFHRQRRHSARAYRPSAAFEEERLVLSNRAA